MNHPSAKRWNDFFRDLSLEGAALLCHLLRCESCSARAASRLGLAPGEVADPKIEEPAAAPGQRYSGLLTRLERTVDDARDSLSRDRAEAETLLRELLRRPTQQARLDHLHAESRFHRPALAERLLAEPADDPARRRDLVLLASAVLDLAPEPPPLGGRFASLRAAAYVALGDALRELADLPGAEAALLFAPEWIERTGDVMDAADFCRGLARLRRDQRRRDEAIALFGRAADLYQEIRQTEGETETRVELGELCLEAAEPGRALAAFLAAVHTEPRALRSRLAGRAASGAVESWLLLRGPEVA